MTVEELEVVVLNAPEAAKEKIRSSLNSEFLEDYADTAVVPMKLDRQADGYFIYLSKRPIPTIPLPSNLLDTQCRESTVRSLY